MNVQRFFHRLWRICTVACCVGAFVGVFLDRPSATLAWVASGITFFILAARNDPDDPAELR